MTKQELKKTLWNAIVNIATTHLADPDEDLGTITKNYLEHLNMPMSESQMIATRMFVQTHASNLANDERFKSRVNVEREEYVDIDTGETMSITRVTISD